MTIVNQQFTPRNQLDGRAGISLKGFDGATMSSDATSSSAGPSLKSRFRGAMLGGVLGDCLGAPLEFRSDRPLPMEKVGAHFKRLRREARENGAHAKGDMPYTDDTAMARVLAESIIAQAKVSCQSAR